jgi:hypothetical protein
MKEELQIIMTACFMFQVERLDGRGSNPDEGIASLHHHVQTSSGTNADSYLMDSGVSFHGSAVGEEFIFINTMKYQRCLREE